MQDVCSIAKSATFLDAQKTTITPALRNRGPLALHPSGRAISQP